MGMSEVSIWVGGEAASYSAAQEIPCFYESCLSKLFVSLGDEAPCSYSSYIMFGAHSGVVVKALRYEVAGHGFDSRWRHWNFSVT
jgi:hypothetical protein